MVRGLALTLFVAVAMTAFVVLLPNGRASAERTSGYRAVDGVSTAGPAIDAQSTTNNAPDTRVAVQVWTVLAAVGAGCVFLLLLLVRMAMGWVKRPPPQEEAHH